VTDSAGSILGAAALRRQSETSALGAVRRVVREIGLGMITLGIVILLFVVYQLFGTTLTEQHDQAALSRSFAQAVARAHAAPVGTGDSPTVAATPTATAGDLSPSTPTGTAVDHLVIPSIGVNKFVVQGTAEANLEMGPGHYVNTPMPGERGNAAIAGHRTTYGAPFFELGHVKKGDYIYLTNTAGRTFDYRVVRSEVVSPSDVSVLDDTPNAELTLTTCNPAYSATSRLVLVADLVGRPIPTPTVTATATAKPVPSQPVNLGSGNTNGWPPAIAYGAAAAVLWILTRILVARSRRWRRLGAFSAGVVVCAVPLWFCFENVVRLLPQNI
jgi:sortase A